MYALRSSENSHRIAKHFLRHYLFLSQRSCRLSRDRRQLSPGFPGFRRTYRTSGHPFTWKTPTPPKDIQTKRFGFGLWVPFSCLRFRFRPSMKFHRRDRERINGDLKRVISQTAPCRATLATPFPALCPRILGTRFTHYGLRMFWGELMVI